MSRDTSWFGPYTLDGETLYVRRHAADSAPHDLPRLHGRLWELLEADFDDPSRPRCTARSTRCVLDNNATDAEGIRNLLGPGFPVTLMPGWKA